MSYDGSVWESCMETSGTLADVNTQLVSFLHAHTMSLYNARISNGLFIKEAPKVLSLFFSVVVDKKDRPVWGIFLNDSM